MKRVLLILAVLLGAVPSFASVAYVQSDGAFTQTSSSTSTQTETLTHTSTALDDLAVSFTQLSTTVHVTYVCGGTSCNQSSFGTLFLPYSGLPTNTGSGNQVWICHHCGATSVITVKTSGNGVFVVLVEEYSGVNSIIQVSSATGTSTTPTISLKIVNANDYIFGSFSTRGSSGVPTAGTGNLRDATRSGTTTSFNGGGAVDNTSSSAGTSVTVSETITSTNDTWTAIGLELSATAQTNPTDFISTYSSEDPGGSETSNYGTSITFPMIPDPVLSGNTVICAVGFTHSTGQTVSAHTLTTIGGSNVDSFTSDKTEDDTSGTTLVILHVAATTGTQYVVYTFGTGLSSGNKLVSSCSEHYNITTSSPVDVSCGATAQAPPNISCGSMTPGSSNDLIYVVGMLDGQNSYGQGFYYTAPGYLFSTIASNGTVGTFAESYVDPNTSAINPAMYLGVTPGANIVAANAINIAGVAYKTTSTGTQPTGIYIARELVFDFIGANFIYASCPSTGNFNSYAFSNATSAAQGLLGWDSNQVSYTWNQITTTGTPTGLLISSSNSTLDPSSACMFDHTQSSNDEVMARDVYNINTATPFDTPTCPTSSPSGNTSGNTKGATGCRNSQAQSAGSITQLPILAPSVSTQTMSIYTLQNGTGPASGVSNVTNIVFDCPVFSAQTDADPFCLGEGHAHAYATSTGNESVTWSVANVVNTGNAAGWDLNATTSSAQFPQVFVIRP